MTAALYLFIDHCANNNLEMQKKLGRCVKQRADEIYFLFSCFRISMRGSEGLMQLLNKQVTSILSESIKPGI